MSNCFASRLNHLQPREQQFSDLIMQLCITCLMGRLVQTHLICHSTYIACCKHMTWEIDEHSKKPDIIPQRLHESVTVYLASIT